MPREITALKVHEGMRFDHLTTIKKVSEKVYSDGKHRMPFWLCQCDCGNTVVVSARGLTENCHHSCGCYNKEVLIAKNTKHSCFHERLYSVWNAMKTRCRNKNNKDYGGRGITFCDEWKDYTNFRNWAMANGYKDNLEIDRIDNNGNYEPSNCRWVTRRENLNNRRVTALVTYNGKTQGLAEWARELGVKHSTLYYRIYKRGWSLERALVPNKENNKCQSIY